MGAASVQRGRASEPGALEITFRQLDWAPDDLVEASRLAGVIKTRPRQDAFPGPLSQFFQSLLNYAVDCGAGGESVPPERSRRLLGSV